MKKYVWAGFAAFFLNTFVVILFPYLLGDFDSVSDSYVIMKAFLYYPTLAGLFGMLFGFAFYQFFIKWPFQNEYANGALWVTVINLGIWILTTNKELKINSDTVESIIIFSLIGLLFVKLTKMFGKGKKKEQVS